MKNKLVLGADPAASSLKNVLIEYLTRKGFEVTDIDQGRCDVPFYESARNASRYILQGKADLGILLCGTGAGMCVAANQFNGITAVCCESVTTAEKARVVNNANVLTMGAFIVDEEKAKAMADAFLSASFGQGLDDALCGFLAEAIEKIRDFRTEKI